VGGGKAVAGAVAGGKASVVASGKSVVSGVGQLFLVWQCRGTPACKLGKKYATAHVTASKNKINLVDSP